MAEFPSLPLFTDAYLADTGHLSEAEHGRYLLLLMTMWRCPECRLPNDKQWLSRRFRKPIEIIEQEWMQLIAEFMQSDGNWITQKRLRKEWEWCIKKRSQRSDAAKSKWGNEKDACKRMSTKTTFRNAPHSTPPIKDLEARTSDAPLPKIKKEASRGTRLPDDFCPSPPDWMTALKLLGWEARVRQELDKFRDYWKAASGASATKRDWDAAWRFWCRRAAERAPPTRQRPPNLEGII